MSIQFDKKYSDVISVENLLLAWQEFARGKRHKPDVQLFARNLMTNIHDLQSDLATQAYKHGGYYGFKISDPKPRDIHKASVRDRLLHHAIYRQLYPFFDRIFVADSYSCRLGKGTQKAGERFRKMANQVSRNNTRTCWVLKGDIRKFFASIDQARLLDILIKRIDDKQILWLLENVIHSFEIGGMPIGLPLGNLTSQLLVNVYMNEFDQFAKHYLKIKQYIRYADDFVVLSDSRPWLQAQIPLMEQFLCEQLSLQLHPTKVKIQTLAAGVDFLGWVYFPHHKVLRTKTKQRMYRRLRAHPTEPTMQSYKGMLQHGNTFKVAQELDNAYWLLREKDEI
ncbi:MAG: reverse transcriptase/maturase family protein, partial [Patescibacteria group bacterium]